MTTGGHVNPKMVVSLMYDNIFNQSIKLIFMFFSNLYQSLTLLSGVLKRHRRVYTEEKLFNKRIPTGEKRFACDHGFK